MTKTSCRWLQCYQKSIVSYGHTSLGAEMQMRENYCCISPVFTIFFVFTFGTLFLLIASALKYKTMVNIFMERSFSYAVGDIRACIPNLQVAP